jgi:hypothetical protein
MKLFKIFCIIALSFLVSSTYAGTIDPNTPDEKYIDFGKKFPYVGMVCGKYENNTNFCASGVAIDHKIVLTAAHVVKNCSTCYLVINEKKLHIPKVIYHNDFQDDVFGFFDIAICLLDDEIGLDFYPELYTNRDEVNKQCTLSGFGITGTFVTGAKISDGKKRGGSNYIDQIDRGLIVCSPSGPGKKTALEFIIAPGDSGGGLFIGNKLAGIHSCVMSIGKNPDSRYGHQSGHTRISDHVDWIRKEIRKKEDSK